MTVKERRTRQKEKLRQEILDAANELFMRNGYENLSMRKLAERIEYSPTTIYLYFKDKADLLAELCEDSLSKLVQQLETIASLASDPVECLRASMLAYVEFGIKNPANYQAICVLPRRHSSPNAAQKDEPAGMTMQTFECFHRAVAECVRSNKFRKLDLDKTSQAIWAMLHGITSLLITHPDFPWVDREELVDHVIDTAIEGLRA